MIKRKEIGTNAIIVFDKIVKASELNSLVKDFGGDVIITQKLVIDRKVDISCNLYVIKGVVRKYPISEFDINIDGDFYCYGEIHCHNINVSGCFYSQNDIYSKNIKVGENFWCDRKIQAFGCNITVAGDFECNDIISDTIECLGRTRMKGSISVQAGIITGYES